MKFSLNSILKIITAALYPLLIYLGVNWFEAADRFTGQLFLLLPVIVNSVLLFTFAVTLLYPPAVIEKIARTISKDLNPDELIYCRKVTLIWSLFFLLNGSTALYLTFYASLEAWTLYNGVVAYVLMGLLFSLEFLYRHWRFRRYVGTPFDSILRRIFPPPVSNAN